MRRPSTIIVLAYSVALHACGGGGSSRNPSTGAKPCQQPAQQKAAAGFNVIGGEAAGDQCPEVLRLDLLNEDGTKAGHCTGSFYSPTTIITAAHCAVGFAGLEIHDTGEKAKRLIPNPAWQGTGDTMAILQIALKAGSLSLDVVIPKAADAPDDVAVIEFEPRNDRKLVKLGKRAVAGQRVRMTGYGTCEDQYQNEHANDLIMRRTGTNELPEVRDGILIQQGGEGGVARISPGDSGSSLFDEATGVAIGITSAGGPASAIQLITQGVEALGYYGVGRNYFVDLRSSGIQNFLVEKFMEIDGEVPWDLNESEGDSDGSEPHSDGSGGATDETPPTPTAPTTPASGDASGKGC